MQRGFSLVELSIVLVILGLLTGGILAGQSLIRAAELRGTIADFQRYQTAVQTFREKYFGLPGDLRNATSFWGIAGGATGNDTTCQNTAATTVATCNGTGDGWIETNAVAYGERFRAWQHLANAGLIEGSYTGRDGAATPGDTSDANFNRPGINVPKGKVSNTLFGIAYRQAVSGDANWFDGGAYNILSLGNMTMNPVLAAEAWTIDTKLDDGRPAYGFIQGLKNTGTWAPGCATTGVSSTAEYNVSSSSGRCPVYWFLR